MKWKDWLDEWKMDRLKVNMKFLEMEWNPKDDDKNAAWDLYIELLTRVTTQYLEPEQGDEIDALNSIHEVFSLTRDIIKKYGRGCEEFTKIAIIVLNQIIRPFTSKWHRKSLHDTVEFKVDCREFRTELRDLQCDLRVYSRMLAGMAGVEDFTCLEID